MVTYSSAGVVGESSQVWKGAVLRNSKALFAQDTRGALPGFCLQVK